MEAISVGLLSAFCTGLIWWAFYDSFRRVKLEQIRILKEAIRNDDEAIKELGDIIARNDESIQRNYKQIENLIELHEGFCEICPHNDDETSIADCLISFQDDECQFQRDLKEKYSRPEKSDEVAEFANKEVANIALIESVRNDAGEFKALVLPDNFDKCLEVNVGKVRSMKAAKSAILEQIHEGNFTIYEDTPGAALEIIEKRREENEQK
jgi:hypothetical protein